MFTTAAWRSFETRLDAVARAIDAVVARLRHARVEGNGRLNRLVDALRAHEASLRIRLRELHEAGPGDWERHGAALERDLDRLRAEAAIAAARLDTELAGDLGTSRPGSWPSSRPGTRGSTAARPAPRPSTS